MYFILSWFYSFVSLAFQVPFSREFGSSGFVLYWCMSFLGMCALGLAIEAVITFSTPRFAPYFLILWIITNVSVSFYPIEMLPSVYRYGYASPFHNIAGTVRTILFSTKDKLGLNFGVQFVWIAVSCVTIPAFTWFTRRREERAWSAGRLGGGHKPEAGKEAA